MGISEDEGLFIKGVNPIDRFPCGAIYPIFEGEGEDPSDAVDDEITKRYDHDPESIWSDSAYTDVYWRKHGEGWIITVSLSNQQRMTAGSQNITDEAKERAEKTFFEARFILRIIEGEAGNYLSADNCLLDDEEQEIELQYKNRKVYAVGHGTGVDWKADKSGAIKYISTESIPTAEVPQITTTNTGYEKTLKLGFLAGAPDNKNEVIEKLTEFIHGYGDWINEQEKEVSKFKQDDKLAGARITNRMRKAQERMGLGIELLNNDDEALLAFSLANQVILNQMMQQNGAENQTKIYAWRPFQLAFLLTVIESSTNSESRYRDLVDLIWFPTGGGKTEAYLGLIAYAIILRRLKYPDTSGGTAALMRYTLRLLAKDQFLRAARMICALELIRRGRDDLGDAPISIGMWVGGDASPNKYDEALEKVNEARETGREPSLVIDKCPWCGKPFSITSGSYRSGKDHFDFICTNEFCEFGGSDKQLPCNVVDDYLYDNPSTLIISTIDKFARMPWEKRVGNFFGKPNNRPPELIIQDELHLISGALGSINGLNGKIAVN